MQHKGMALVIFLQYLIISAHGADPVKMHNLRCNGHSCNPPVGNLAAGRTPSTLTTCGQNNSELYCFYSEQTSPSSSPTECGFPKCTKCNANQPDNAHLPSDMTDDFFLNPASWWQSAQGIHREEVRLDFGTEFYLTHVIVVFRSPRPAAMVLERSQDHGHTWRPYKYFATNCTATFGVQDDLMDEGSMCTSRYSKAWPCTRGEVIYRAMTPANKIEDPYSPEAQDLLKLTNLRLVLLKRQECPCQRLELLGKPQKLAHYAIYDLIVRGSCVCNGHAEECQLVSGPGSSGNAVDGKCECRHHTAGDHCERCASLYNDQPWRPGDGKTGAPNECRKCRCHNHAESCHFDLSVWLGSGNRSGGVCDHCKHHTEGHRCQRCTSGFYRDRGNPSSSPAICKPCLCHPMGTTNATFHRNWRCHPKTGFCYCKPGVAGPRCDRCMMGYWGFGVNGCLPCDCAMDCNRQTGECLNSYEAPHSFSIPVGGRIPELTETSANESEEEWKWSSEQGFSAMRHPEKCVCKERLLGSVADFCRMKYAYVIKASILSAHDKGTHAEVVVKVKKILKSGKVKITRGNRSIYPESWTNRGCTCPILNPGTDYLIAGQEEPHSKKLLVNMNSLVKPWKVVLGKQAADILQTGCR
ncbi:LOW QUALITY PROTEIN: netrin-4-like [Rhinatrema bivittatum]|uniref:LOW QUALITY PROTEIN: netrin-4-like n=1 Tax=Rhinatrema bivittatum TaxID=194408 RepID=UPI0011266470|nr:LOW QUALITY PROTEIN: netrin-4-like [Rhinatrema bivittatum]